MRILKVLSLVGSLPIAVLAASSCHGLTPETSVTEENLTISLSKKLISADGVDAATITVKLGSEDVTSDSRIYVGDKALDGNVFSTSTPKEYKIWASYKTKITEKVSLTAYTSNLKAELPADPQPTKYDSFKRNILLLQGTGDWCVNCPPVIKALDMYLDAGPKRDNVVLVAAHSGDDMACTFNTTLFTYCSITGFPTVCYNLDKTVKTYNTGNSSLVYEDLVSKVQMELLESAACGISLSSNLASNVLSLNAQVKFAKDGNYRVNVWLVEDGFVSDQTGATNVGLTNPLTHNHVLRSALKTSRAYGEAINGQETYKKGEKADFYLEYSLEGVINDTDKARVIVLISRLVNDTFYVTNLMESELVSAVPYIYE